MSLTVLDLLVIAVPFTVVIVMAMAMRRYTRSVADYLAANRCAGRYLITCAAGETSVGIVLLAASLEMFSQAGFSLSLWAGLVATVMFFIGILGVVTYRMRETRVLTFHQFFEVRYSRGVRVLASVLNVLSGIFSFGVMPAVGSRFFVYFCGFPEMMRLGSVSAPTYVVIMLVLMALSLLMTLSGGQISIMITDSLEALISSFFYVIIAVFIVATVSAGQMRDVLFSGAPGKSYIDPFDIAKHKDFNGWFILLTMLLNVYQFRGGVQGFSTAAKSAHEARMANILSNWRLYNYTAMVVLISLAAFTVLHHPDFAGAAALVERGLEHVGSAQLKIQMRMPMALGMLLSPGIKGCFCAVALFGLLANQGQQIHAYGSTILQDVVLPLRKKAMSPGFHVAALRGCTVFVAAFACFFSVIYTPAEYLAMLLRLIGSIYLGGLGCALWGGLYWRRGTTAGAAASLLVGATLALALNVVPLPQVWGALGPWLGWQLGPGPVAEYLAAHADKFPVNGQWLSLVIALVSIVVYVAVSLLTCREPFNMEAMLHRGKYRVEEDGVAPAMPLSRSLLSKMVNITGEFSRRDKALAYVTVGWTLFWKLLVVGLVLWTILCGRLSKEWWFHYTMISSVWVTLTLGTIVTFWFAWGIIKDMSRLFGTLATASRDYADDGRVQHPGDTGQTNP